MDISLKRLLPGEKLIQYGCTPGWVTLSRTKDGIYVIRLKGEKNPENFLECGWVRLLQRVAGQTFEGLIEIVVTHRTSYVRTW